MLKTLLLIDAGDDSRAQGVAKIGNLSFLPVGNIEVRSMSMSGKQGTLNVATFLLWRLERDIRGPVFALTANWQIRITTTCVGHLLRLTDSIIEDIPQVP
ncbi:MAG: hypothetical protein ACK4UW_14260 [Rhizobium rhizophilum]|uniref:hypothetical protein n=1 Tax=Rhizobium rhizophilum TaxID=1850373 RepID=UPI00391A9F00